MTKSDDKKVPALRFKGFTDDWEQRKLGEVLLVNSGKDYKNLNKGNIPVYGTGGYMLSVNRALSNENAIGIGRKGTIDRPQYLIAPFWTVDTLFFLTVKNQNDLKFFYALFQKINWKKYDESTGLPSLSKSTLNNIFLKNPNYKEQKKIGLLLSQIEVLITLQQRKLRYLSAIKKSLLQNMLVDNDLRPELRFTKFSGNWEQHKISEMAKRLDNLRIPVTASNRKKGDIPYYGANGIQDYVEGFTHKGENILIAEDGANNLDNYPIRLVKGKIWVNNHAHVLKAYKNCTDIQFLEFELKKLNIYKYLVGGSRLKLNADILMNISIKSPTLKEQKKIGFMLSLLEENTIFQQRKLNKLELLNQFFLQHMFI
ncbi:restriction endonuclease subunit S [Lactobacillus johnsonii]|uniref:restriction endonuclease subunit S n=1 Tax=Lactobacillus johnsonii TaxID=33959 RepID=UPI003CFF43E7